MHVRAIQSWNDTGTTVLVLGTGDIASAIARSLFVSGRNVVMLRDPTTPVLRRGMAFDDALETGLAELEGVWAMRATAPEALALLAPAREGVVVANFDLAIVLSACHGLASAILDARMRKYATPPDLRPLVACAIGIGPGFTAGENVDIAIETLPGREGSLVEHGATATATGRAVPLGGAADERFVTAPHGGPWLPLAALGGHVEAGSEIGALGSTPVVASIDGCLRGLVRAMPSGIARGSKLAEIDPSADASATGIPPRARRIAAGVQTALAALLPIGRTYVSVWSKRDECE